MTTTTQNEPSSQKVQEKIVATTVKSTGSNRYDINNTSSSITLLPTSSFSLMNNNDPTSVTAKTDAVIYPNTTTMTTTKRNIDTVEEEVAAAAATAAVVFEPLDYDEDEERVQLEALDDNNLRLNDDEYDELLNFVDNIDLLEDDKFTGQDNYNNKDEESIKQYEKLIEENGEDDDAEDGDDEDDEELNQYINKNSTTTETVTTTNVVSRSSSIGSGSSSMNYKRNVDLHEKLIYQRSSGGQKNESTSTSTSNVILEDDEETKDQQHETVRGNVEVDEQHVRQVQKTTTTELPIVTNRPSTALYLSCDYQLMTPYQCFIRQQIEIFETTSIIDENNTSNILSTALNGNNGINKAASAPATIQGRNKPIVLGQVGVRCIYCFQPKNISRTAPTRGSMYYPSKLDGIYQATNNIVNIHYLQNYCKHIPADKLNTLRQLKEQGSSNTSNENQTSKTSDTSSHTPFNNTITKGAGKVQWAQRAAILGVYEDTTNNILRFYPTIMYVHDQHFLEKNNENTAKKEQK